ncbi:hypothetical protein, conserved in T. vivax [Trypanosoma vivax Y486]|uniref:Uncharacterized protein n=1 Tax=Trypanosoma vivax (strain Y486) TaxID=1055687 RepID=F9WKH3_TRYVY|nr:hypothetical protein, conserved in T. vivax [Trypanosoma vivax Y486]|eukprot:CCD17993.1 hypothetical protein, conserved in T. vivax [Trypanosoma vivax Y486]
MEEDAMQTARATHRQQVTSATPCAVKTQKKGDGNKIQETEEASITKARMETQHRGQSTRREKHRKPPAKGKTTQKKRNEAHVAAQGSRTQQQGTPNTRRDNKRKTHCRTQKTTTDTRLRMPAQRRRRNCGRNHDRREFLLTSTRKRRGRRTQKHTREQAHRATETLHSNSSKEPHRKHDTRSGKDATTGTAHTPLCQRKWTRDAHKARAHTGSAHNRKQSASGNGKSNTTRVPSAQGQKIQRREHKAKPRSARRRT